MKPQTREKLRLLGQVSTNHYPLMRYVGAEYVAGRVTVREAGYVDWFKKNNPDVYDIYKDLKDFDTNPAQSLWCVHKQCVNMTLMDSDAGLVLEIQMYEGSLYDGSPERMWWTGAFTGFADETAVLTMIENTIDWAFKEHLEDLFEKEEETRKRRRMRAIARKMLGPTYTETTDETA